MTHSSFSAFDEVNEKVAQAGELLNLKAGVIKALSSCEREVVISIPLRRDDDVEVLTDTECNIPAHEDRVKVELDFTKM